MNAVTREEKQQGHSWFQSSTHVTVKPSSTCRAEGQCLSSLALVPSDAGPCPATLMQSGGSQAALSQPQQHLFSQRQSCPDMKSTVIDASVPPVERQSAIIMKVFGVERTIKTRRRNGCRVLVITTTRVRACVCVSVLQIGHDAHSWSPRMSLTATLPANMYGRAGTKTRGLRAPWREHAPPQPAEVHCLKRRRCAWRNVSIKPRNSLRSDAVSFSSSSRTNKGRRCARRATNLGGVTSCYPLVTMEIQHHESSA